MNIFKMLWIKIILHFRDSFTWFCLKLECFLPMLDDPHQPQCKRTSHHLKNIDLDRGPFGNNIGIVSFVYFKYLVVPVKGKYSRRIWVLILLFPYMLFFGLNTKIMR
jgi:hypothetical protein